MTKTALNATWCSGAAMAAGIFLLGLCLAVAAGLWLQRDIDGQAQDDFQRSVDRVAADVSRRFSQPIYGMRGAVGLYAASAKVRRSEFRAYVEARDLPREFPGVRGFGFIQRVTRDGLDQFIAAERSDDAPQFAVRALDGGASADLYVIKFIEPAAPNFGALGLDVGSEPRRRAAAEQAVRSGEPALTAPIVLVQDARRTPGFLLYVPVFRHGADPVTPAQRQAALVGLVYAPIVASELLSGGADTQAGQVDVALFDAAGSEPFFDSRASLSPAGSAPNAAVAKARFELTRTLALPGRDVTLQVRSTPRFEAAYSSAPPWLLFQAGLLASGLLAALLWQQANARRRAETIAQGMTADLARLAQVVRHTSNAVSITDRDLRITWINEGFTRISGYGAEDALGKTPGELLGSGKADPAVLKTLADSAAAGTGCRVEIVNRAKDGHEYWIEAEVQPLRDAQGRLTGFMEIGTEITARKRIEAALHASQAFLDKAGRIGGVGGWAMDLATRTPQWTDQTCRIFDVEPGEQPTFEQCMSHYTAEVQQAIQRAVSHSVKTGASFDLELPATTAQGRAIWVRGTGEAEFVDGRAVRVIGAFQDITARRAMESELRRSNEMLGSVIENLPCGLSVFDADLQLVAANQAYRRMLDLPEALFARPPTRYADIVRFNAARGEYGAEEAEQTVQFLMERVRGPVTAHQFERVRPDGTVLEILGAPMPGGGLVATYTDISARRKAEAEVQRSAQLLRGAIDAIDEAFVLYDPEDRLVFCNDKYRKIYEASSEAIVPGAAFEDIVRYGAERGQYTEAIGRVDEWVAERMAVHRAGNTTLVQRLEDGRSLRILERKMPDGHIVGFRIDITELVRATEAAEQASRAKSQFLANMSHEIRTPMNAILGMLALLRKTELSPRQADYASKTDGAARSLLGLLNDILDFSKVEAGKMTLDLQPFRVDQVLRDLSVILSAGVGGKSLELLFDIDPTVPRHLLGDAMRLQQVLINLGGNAVKFTQQGEVVVSVRVVERGAAEVTLEWAVRDTGIGIAPENQQRIFSGFTQAEASITRRFGGTGLGVAISQRLVALMGGELRLDSALGQGSRFHFRITLPLADESASATPVAAAAGVPLRALVVDDNPTERAAQRLAGLRLLVVEDNLNNQQVARELLEDEGALVQLAHHGQQAVAAVAAAQPQFDVVLMDLQMPVMDGFTATSRIRQQLGLQTLPIVAMTANALSSDRDACLAAGMNDHVGKPFDLDHLVRVLRRHADRLPMPDADAEAGEPPLPAAMVQAAATAGVDIATALRRLGGKPMVYRRLLRNFIADLQAMPAQLRALRGQGRIEPAAQLLHTFKGLAGTLGATALAAAAAQAERELAGGAAADAMQVIEQACHAIVMAEPGLAALWQAMPGDDGPRAESASAADARVLRSALQPLVEYLRNSDMAALEAMGSLQRDFGRTLGTTLAPLDDAIGALDFERALGLCDELMKGLGE